MTETYFITKRTHHAPDHDGATGYYTYEEISAADLPEWKPIDQYREPPYAGYSPIVLLGWWVDEAGGYPAAMRRFGCGYMGTNKRWHDISDNEEWLYSPTHFALICNHIPLAANALAGIGDLDV